MCLETRGTGEIIVMKWSKLVPLPRGDKSFPFGVYRQTNFLVSQRAQKQALLSATYSPHTTGMLNKTPMLLPDPSVVLPLPQCLVYLLQSGAHLETYKNASQHSQCPTHSHTSYNCHLTQWPQQRGL